MYVLVDANAAAVVVDILHLDDEFIIEIEDGEKSPPINLSCLSRSTDAREAHTSHCVLISDGLVLISPIETG